MFGGCIHYTLMLEECFGGIFSLRAFGLFVFFGFKVGNPYNCDNSLITCAQSAGCMASERVVSVAVAKSHDEFVTYLGMEKAVA